MREVTLSESSALTIKEASIFWDKARIPRRKESHCTLRRVKISGNAKQKVQIFAEKMNDLFDISHGNTLQLMAIEEKQF